MTISRALDSEFLGDMLTRIVIDDDGRTTRTGLGRWEMARYHAKVFPANTRKVPACQAVVP